MPCTAAVLGVVEDVRSGLDAVTENKTDMWLGVNIKSAGADDLIIVCAKAVSKS